MKITEAFPDAPVIDLTGKKVAEEPKAEEPKAEEAPKPKKRRSRKKKTESDD